MEEDDEDVDKEEEDEETDDEDVEELDEVESDVVDPEAAYEKAVRMMYLGMIMPILIALALLIVYCIYDAKCKKKNAN